MRSDPYITVSCDRCKGYEDEVPLTALARGSYDERDVDGRLELRGWRISDGEDICPECVYEEERDDQHDEDEHNYQRIVADGLKGR